MAIGVYRIPRQFQDEDKWFRFFTKTQLLIMMIGIAISALVWAICMPFKIYSVAIVFTVAVLLICGLLAFFKMPENKYIYGGGYPSYQLLLRLVRKYFLSKKQIYIKMGEQEESK